MKFLPMRIPEVKLIIPDVYEDERGFFMETYQRDLFEEAGISVSFVQDNHSGSRLGVLRGLHYQVQNVQGKLVRVIVGEVFDVAVDIRKSSPTFGQWVGARLSAQNRNQLWVPPGFAHGFYTLSEWAEVHYKTTDFYAARWERSLRWDDPQIGIEWPLIEGGQPKLSEKDSRANKLQDAELFD